MSRHALTWYAASLLAACGSNPDAAPDPDAGGDPDAGVGCSEADLAACEYGSFGGSFTERMTTITDPSTGRTLPLLARVPDLPGPLPVFVWSHGGAFFAGGELKSKEWGEAIASEGWVVIHVGHSALTTETGTKICELASVPAEECVPPGPDDDDTSLVAIGKALDLKAVLDNLETLSDLSVDNGGPALDLARVAVGGWSGGSRGPQILFGARVEPSPSAPLFALPDDRVVAGVFMSPAGPEFGGFFDHGGGDTSWSMVRGPTLVATGTNDVKPNKPELTGDIRRQAFINQPADGTRRLLFSNLPVGVGGHPTFDLEDLDSTDERISRLSRALRSAVLAHLDATVLDSSEAQAWLATDNARILAGDADWELK